MKLLSLFVLFMPLTLLANEKDVTCEKGRATCHVLECRVTKQSPTSKLYEIYPVALKLRNNDDSGNGLPYFNGQFQHKRDMYGTNKIDIHTTYFHFSGTGAGKNSQAVSDLNKNEILALVPFYYHSDKKQFKSTLRYLTTSAGWRGSPFLIESEVDCIYTH